MSNKFDLIAFIYTPFYSRCIDGYVLDLSPLDKSVHCDSCNTCGADGSESASTVQRLETEWEEKMASDANDVEEMLQFLDSSCRPRLHVNHALMTRIRQGPAAEIYFKFICK
jgi:hypothetical protein